MANSAIQLPSPGVGVEGQHPNFRNKFINGDFQWWQRGINFPSPALNTYTADRWAIRGRQTGPGVLTTDVAKFVFQPGPVLGVADEPDNYVRVKANVASGSGNEIAALVQRIRNVWTFSDTRITVSFWARGNTPGQIALSIKQYFGSLGSPDVYLPAVNVNLTGSWQKYVYKFDVPDVSSTPSIGPFDINGEGDNSLRFRWVSSAGTTTIANENFPNTIDYTDYWFLADVQVEEGDIGDPVFDRRNKLIELEMCQRYYQQTMDAGLPLGTPVVAGPHIFEADGPSGNKSVGFQTQLRIAPSINVWSEDGISGPFMANKIYGGPIPPTDITVNAIATSGFAYAYGLVPPFNALDDNHYGFHWTADAEL